MLARTIAVELAKHNITVNNIGPGAIYTPIDADIEAKPELEKALMGEIPLNRWGQPSDVAGFGRLPGVGRSRVHYRLDVFYRWRNAAAVRKLLIEGA